ncbi:MAG: hypothetical protein QXG86_02910 [Candidatus Woesearchaeota archaeon]
MNKKTIYTVTFFMIFLIITIPFYVSNAYAQQDVSKIDRIVYPTPTGTGNASGYMMPTDTLRIVANLRAKNLLEEEAASRVFFTGGDVKEPFNSCKSLGENWYDCTYEKNFVELLPGIYEGNIILEADDCVGCVKPFQITVDGYAPKILTADMTPQITNSKEINVIYRIEDSACDSPQCKGRCAGINKIFFYPENDIRNIQVIDISQEQKCELSNAKIVNISMLKSGVYSLCVAASDKAGNGDLLNNKKCQTIIIDREAPVVSSVLITDTNGNIVSYLPEWGANIILTANITSDYADLTKAEVNLSAFNLPIRDMSCQKQTNSRVWVCKTTFIALLPFDASAQTIPIYTYDSAGNSDKKDFVFGLKTDTSKPQLDSVKTNYMFNNTPYLGKKDNILSVIVNDIGAGLSKNNTYAVGFDNYFDVVSRGPQTLYKAHCSFSGNRWECYWPPLSIKTNEEFATLTFRVIDDAENYVEETKKIKIDKKVPTIKDIEMHTSNAFPAVGVGEDVVIRLNISDDSSILDDRGNFDIFMDTTPIEGGAGWRRADSCSLINISYIERDIVNSTDWVCIWSIRGVKEIKGWYPKINVSDITGNNFFGVTAPDLLYVAYVSPVTGNTSYKQKTDGFDVLPKEENVSDYWRVDIAETIPQRIDRQIAPLLDTNVYSKLSFTALQNNPQRIAVSVEECSNDGTAKSFTLFPEDPLEPYIETIVSSGYYGDVESLSYVCTIGTVSVVNDVLTQKELDNVTIQIELYNMPLGRIDKAIKDKVDDVKKFVKNDFYKFMGTLKKLMDIGNILCTTWGIISGWVNVIHKLAAVIKGAPVAELLQGLVDAISASEGAGDGVVSLIEKTVRPMCKFLKCELTYNEKVLNKTNEVIKDITNNIIETPPAEVIYSQSQKNFLKKIEFGLITLGGGEVFGLSNPSDSLILSIATGCLPGTIYNFEKLRQIECQKGLCYMTMSKEGGPLYACDEMYSNQMCSAVVGEVFSLVPFAHFTRSISSFITGMLSNPASFAFTVAWLLCLPRMKTAEGSVCTSIANTEHVLNFVVETITFVATIEDTFKRTWEDADVCTSFEDEYDSFKEELENVSG